MKQDMQLVIKKCDKRMNFYGWCDLMRWEKTAGNQQFLAIYFTFTPIKFIQQETDFGPDI